MIKFKREGKCVKCQIDLDVPNYDSRVFGLNWNCESEVYAGLLSAEFTKQYRQAIKSLVQGYYEQGYKDGKGKRRKERFFQTWL